MKCEQCKRFKGIETEMELGEYKGQKVWKCPNPDCGWMEAADKTWQGFHPPLGK